MSTSIHIENNIADFTRDICRRCCKNGGSIFDVTCGKYNRQFKKYFSTKEEYLYDENFFYKGTDLIYGFDVFKEKSNEPYYDIVYYDPPYLPAPKFDKRADNYGNQRISIEEIKEFFSIPVIKNLMSFSRKYLVIRGMDFYYPINSFNFYSFYELCMKKIIEQTEFNLFGLYIMRFNRNDIDKIIEINKRPVINYSYAVVFQKGDFAV